VRRALPLATLAAGLSLLAGGVTGMARIDTRLAAATPPAVDYRVTDGPRRDCPKDERRADEAPAEQPALQ
jgi:hypothetical protein